MNEVKDMLDENIDRSGKDQELAIEIMKPENIFLIEKMIGEIDDWRSYCSVFRYLFRNCKRNQSLKIAEAFDPDSIQCSWPIKYFLLLDAKNMFYRFDMDERVQETREKIEEIKRLQAEEAL